MKFSTRRFARIAGTAVALAAAGLAGCATNHTGAFPKTLDHDVCRDYPGSVINGYDFAYRVSSDSGSVHSGRVATLVPTQGGGTISMFEGESTPYLKASEMATVDDKISKTRMYMGNVETGLELSATLDEDIQGFSFDLTLSELTSIELVGDKKRSFVEKPKVDVHQVAGSALIDEKVDLRFGNVQKGRLARLFGSDTVKSEDRPFHLEMIACPITSKKAGDLTLE